MLAENGLPLFAGSQRHEAARDIRLLGAVASKLNSRACGRARFGLRSIVSTAPMLSAKYPTARQFIAKSASFLLIANARLRESGEKGHSLDHFLVDAQAVQNVFGFLSDAS